MLAPKFAKVYSPRTEPTLPHYELFFLIFQPAYSDAFWGNTSDSYEDRQRIKNLGHLQIAHAEDFYILSSFVAIFYHPRFAISLCHQPPRQHSPLLLWLGCDV